MLETYSTPIGDRINLARLPVLRITVIMNKDRKSQTSEGAVVTHRVGVGWGLAKAVLTCFIRRCSGKPYRATQRREEVTSEVSAMPNYQTIG